ncbi:MAG: hypothetical protein DCC68_09500 [Planctomycetota bacterium]|nr:MAG: hypothetical protein DCC68_09500 [Planctomycetota bacterium]
MASTAGVICAEADDARWDASWNTLGEIWRVFFWGTWWKVASLAQERELFDTSRVFGRGIRGANSSGEGIIQRFSRFF